LNEDWRKYMKEILLENGIKLWVVDNIASLAPGIDENSKKDWDPINQFFIDLRFHGITTTFLHHPGKDGSQRGTSGREDNLDISISLDFPQGYTREDGCRFICKFVKTRIPHADLPLVADIEMWWRPDENGIYTWVFQGVRKQHKVEVVKRLHDGKSQKDIATDLGITPARVSQLKKEAVQDGLITEAGKLTQTGLEWLQKT
jgi:putative DNA primase/helicase